MKKKIFIVVFLGLSLWAIFGKGPDYSESERRALADFPKVTVENVLNGKFSKEFDEYAVERFPVRDAWRRVKAYAKTKLFLQKDNYQIYTAEGHLSKMNYPMNPKMMEHAVDVFGKVREAYLKDNDVYVAVIPDKNRYLAEANGYLAMDYQAFSEQMAQQMDYASYIEIADLLEADDYYTTDTHWRQDKILDVAQRLAGEMGVALTSEYEEKELDEPFYGVYVGQSALICEPDEIIYLENEGTEAAVLEGAKAVYDMAKAKSRDPYEMFLSGNQPIVTMKNPLNKEGKRLILFRDSYGSSIAPLLLEGYSEVVLVDLRYISSSMLEEYVDFKNADVLFLYSTLLLNDSLALK